MMLDCPDCHGEGYIETARGKVYICRRCNGTGFDQCCASDLFEPEDFFSPPRPRNTGGDITSSLAYHSDQPGPKAK
jgi:hypothetical protein